VYQITSYSDISENIIKIGDFMNSKFSAKTLTLSVLAFALFVSGLSGKVLAQSGNLPAGVQKVNSIEGITKLGK
jgi:hypothetical protein